MSSMSKKIWGLTTEQANENRKLGSNALSAKKQKSFWMRLWESLKEDSTKIFLVVNAIQWSLYVATLIWPSVGCEDWIGPVILSGIIITVSGVSSFMGWSLDRGAQALLEEARKLFCKVYRDGKLIELHSDDMVIGDEFQAQSGDMITADGEVVYGSMKVNQAPLNGESEDAEKEAVTEGEEMPAGADKDTYNKHRVFRGSVVTQGSGIIRVTTVGDNTMLGEINQRIQDNEDETMTPPEEQRKRLLDNIGTYGKWAGVAAAVIDLVRTLANMPNFTVGIILRVILDCVLMGITLYIMAFPEGLPLMNTLVQCLNLGKMRRDHILVKNFKAGETAGYLDKLFTDKTGTLTYGQMQVANVVTGDGAVHEDFNSIDEKIRTDIIIGAGVNNDATVSGDGKPIGSNDTDRALIAYLAIKNGAQIDKSLVATAEPFDSKKKYASVTLQSGVTYFKGAPDIIIQDCKSFIGDDGAKHLMEEQAYENLMNAWRAQTERAMRVIAVVKEEDGEKIFVSMISIRDDVRSDVKRTVCELNRAGVDVTMVTGDVLGTAKAIARDANLVTSDDDLCITHNDLEAMSDEELIKKLSRIKVVARAIPSDKERLVKVSQSVGHVVGMTGDGVNDAPALHKADVGFAMGSGTEVAKEASDIIILNDSLTSIADAILYGRTMSKSIKKFIIFQLTVNVSAMFTNIVCMLMGYAALFSAKQILWINVIMDTLAAIAFGKEAARKSYMEEKPVSRTSDILNGYMKSAIITGGTFATVVCLGIMKNAFGIYSLIGTTDMGVITSFVFATYIFMILWNGINARTESMNLFENISKNPNFILVMSGVALFQVLVMQYAGIIFDTVPMSFQNWILAAGIGFLIVPVDLVRKAIVKKMGIKE